MFVVSKTPSYFWPVTVSTPKSGGAFEKETFEVEFKRIPNSEVKKIFVDGDISVKDAEFCRKNVIGWKDIKGADGEQIPFSLSALDELLEIPTIDRKIVEAFLESLSGSRVKN
jgi:hypothetical protein